MPDKTFGAASGASGGFIRTQVDPDRWLESLVRALKNYIDSNLSDVYEVVTEFPAGDALARLPKTERTVIHFEIDDVDDVVFGMGDNFVDDIYDESNVLVTGIEALCKRVRFDVGIWASHQSGGVTARLRAYQHLSRLLNGSQAYKRALQHDFEILEFTGGTFVREEVGEIPVFRVVAATLVLRVYPRAFADPVTFVEEVEQDQNLEILEGVPIVG